MYRTWITLILLLWNISGSLALALDYLIYSLAFYSFIDFMCLLCLILFLVEMKNILIFIALWKDVYVHRLEGNFCLLCNFYFFIFYLKLSIFKNFSAMYLRKKGFSANIIVICIAFIHYSVSFINLFILYNFIK